MANATVQLEDLETRIANRERRSLIRTVLASLVVVLAAAAFLWFTLRELNEASGRLSAVKSDLESARQELSSVEAQRDTALSEASAAISARDSAVAAQKDAEAAAAKFKSQVSELESKVSDLEAALKESLNLEKHIYELNFDDIKAMYAVDDRAADLLGVIANLRTQVHWDIRNASAGGFNSPAFAAQVLGQYRNVDPRTALSDLPRDDAPPHLGDIVTYASGYHLFYFRDIDGKEFVVGMTPFGVLALNYDFGVARGQVVHTGVSQR